MTVNAEASIPAAPAGEVSAVARRHPRGLYFLFATEMWERFSYYGMRALLTLYLITYLQFLPEQSSNVYKWYTSLVYLTPLLGGFLADRYLGLRASIIAGAVLMSIGHFLMAFEPLPIFYAALAFLIAGNGFFKPNISTLVGKMYRAGDPRRDGAFTIFYMGINLGAFLSPLICGWLHVRFGFHYGFAAAGVGMVCGLVIFLAGQKQVVADVRAAGNDLTTASKQDAAKVLVVDESKASPYRGGRMREVELREPGASGLAGLVSRAVPVLMIAASVGAPAYYVRLYLRQEAGLTDLVMPVAFGAVAGWMGVILMRRVWGASRDKSIVIFVLFAFAVLFWMAFEQAGNALNIWAYAHTDLHLGSFEYPAEWFQSVNAILIFALAPVFAALWVWLAKRKVEPSTPAKMLGGMFFMGLSFLAMVSGAAIENAHVTRAPLAEVPEGVDLARLDAGRLAYDGATHELVVHGVLPEFARREALRQSASPGFVASVDALEQVAQGASAAHPVAAPLRDVPPFYRPPALPEVGWDPSSATLTLSVAPDAKLRNALLEPAAPEAWRAATAALAAQSQAARVSGFWLFLSYLMATLGELCLSPVGLSMVTKLAPARFASLFMGVWMLASSVAQYVGGSIGQSWGRIAPQSYFTLFVWTSAIGFVVLLCLVRPLKRLMHEVG